MVPTSDVEQPCARRCANCDHYDDDVAYTTGVIFPATRYVCTALTTQSGAIFTVTPDWFCADFSPASTEAK